MNVWRERLGRWFAPIGRHSPLSPNAITVVAVLLSLGGAACLYRGGSRPVLFLVAVVLIGLGGLADALDGVVAREQGKSSRFGDFLDHAGDRVSDSLVAAAWAVGSGVRVELVVLSLFLVMFNGYLGTQIEATFAKRNYDLVGRGEFVLGLILFPIMSYILATNGWSTLRPGTLSIAEWMTLLLIVMALVAVVQRIRLAARLS
jgi:archaetidylinositol phosphate synthase